MLNVHRSPRLKQKEKQKREESDQRQVNEASVVCGRQSGRGLLVTPPRQLWHREPLHELGSSSSA